MAGDANGERGQALPDRIAIDANGYGWRVWSGEDHWSMVPVNPDNEPIPKPVTWFVPVPSAEWLARVQWEAEGHRQHGIGLSWDDLPSQMQAPRLKWAREVLAAMVANGGRRPPDA